MKDFLSVDIQKYEESIYEEFSYGGYRVGGISEVIVAMGDFDDLLSENPAFMDWITDKFA